MSAAALLLAAGGSRRFGEENKLLAPLRGRPLLEWALDAALAAGLDGVYVVVGNTNLPLPNRVTPVRNPRWREGQATSLRAGIDAARAKGHRAVVVALADQPLLEASAWRAVADTDAPIAVATYGGRRGHPVRLDHEVWPMLPRKGETGARPTMTEHPGLVVEVPCRGDPSDVDTVDDLDTLQETLQRAENIPSTEAPERT